MTFAHFSHKILGNLIYYLAKFQSQVLIVSNWTYLLYFLPIKQQEQFRTN
jgi:hypothetical protein